MKTFANWMTVIFMIMYWGFRIFVTYMFTNGKSWWIYLFWNQFNVLWI